MTVQIDYPRDFIADTKGRPLESGSVYVGTASQDPQVFPIPCFWDEALTIPAAQPFTVSAGYIMRSGARAAVWTSPDSFSMRIRDRAGVEIDYLPEAEAGSVSQSSFAAGLATKADNLFTRASPGAVPATIASKLSDIVSVKDFGAFGDNASHTLAATTSLGGQNTTSWTLAQWHAIYPRATALTQQVDYLAHDAALQLGRTVVAPFGSYIMGSDTCTVTVNGASLLGDCRTALGTTWVTSSATGDLFVLDGVSGNFIDNGRIRSSVNKTAGCGIKMIRSHNTSSRGMRFDDGPGGEKLFSCYDLEAGTAQFLYAIEDYELSSGSYGIRIGALGTGQVQDVWIGKGVGSGLTQAGMYVVNASGIFINEAPDFISCKNALATNPGAGDVVKGLISSGFLADSSTGHGVLLGTAGGLVADCILANLWTASSGVLQSGNATSGLCAGLYAEMGTGVIDGISLPGLRAVENVSNGVHIQKARNIHFTGAQLHANSVKSAGTFHGAYVGAGAVDVSFTGGRSGPAGRFVNQGGPSTQSYGLFIDTGALRTIDNGMNTYGNVTGGVSDNGTTSWINKPSWA